MRGALCLLLLLFAALRGDIARAEATDLCAVLSRLERLPHVVTLAQTGQMSLPDAQNQVLQVAAALDMPDFTEHVPARALSRLRGFTDAVDRRLSAIGERPAGGDGGAAGGPTIALAPQITSLISRLGCADELAEEALPEGSDTGLPGTSAGQTPQAPAASGDTGRAGGASSSGMAMLTLTALIGAVGVPAYFWFSQVSRRNRIKRGCCVKALLVYGELCTVTYVLQVGKKGAKLQAPSIELPDDGIELFVAGHRIKARKDWMNQYYLGLSFVSPLSDKVVAEIIAASREMDQLSRLEENPPDCFYTDCYLDCRNHRETQLALNASNKENEVAAVAD